MNNKGYIDVATMLLILFVSLMLFGVFYARNVSVVADTDNSIKTVDVVNDSKKGLERTHALLSKNVSYDGLVKYADINKEYFISTISEEFETKNLTSSNSLKFNVTNKTPLKVKITVFPTNESLPHSYGVELVYKGENLLSNAQDLYYDFEQTISSEKIYNSKTQESNYGDYFLNITNLENATLKIDITYDILREREILLKGPNIEKEVLISNSNGLSVKFKGGK